MLRRTLPLLFLAACTEHAPAFYGLSNEYIDHTTGCMASGCEATLDDTPTGDGIATVTGDVDNDTSGGVSSGSTHAEDPGSDTGSTTDAADLPPTLGPHAVTPNHTDVNALLEITATANHAEGVRLQIDDGDPVELVQVAPGEFAGEIPAFTGMHNGKHVARLVAWHGELESEAAEVEYVIALPPPSFERYWSVSGQSGYVAAIDVLPDGRPVEFGTFFEDGEPRCYLNLRDLDGSPIEFLPVLSSAYCRATDLTIDETGMMHVLVDRKGGNGIVWWVGQIAAWGLGPVNIGTGAVGDTAMAMARHPDMIAVCGTQANDEPDGRDALAVLLRPGEAAEPRLFDYIPKDDLFTPHRFGENVRDCKLSGDTLVLVGEAWGYHGDDDAIERDRLAVLEYDVMVGGDGEWTVAGPGPGVQSRALALDIDSEGSLYIAGYTCADDCKPDGEVRVYEPGGVLTAQVQLGAIGSLWLVALGAQVGQEFVFQVQAIAADKPGPLWTFTPKDTLGPQLGLAVTTGPFGEVYAGGLGAGNRPAFAVIGG